MTPTTDELTYARSWIGNTETDEIFIERVTRLAERTTWDDRQQVIDAAIEEFMRSQLSAMEFDNPSSVSLPGGITVSYGENMRGIKDRLENFIGNYSTASGQGVGGGFKVYQIVRDSRR